MSFIFGRNKKGSTGGLPAATREISSSHGPDTRISSAAGMNANPREGIERRGTVGTQPAPNLSVNSSLSSIKQGVSSPEPGPMRPRADSDANATRTGPPRAPVVAVAPTAPADSPYPWSQRRLEFTSGASPFPRYGAAINATASKEGWIYLMGGLINGTMVKGDLWIVECAGGRMNCFPIQTENGPSPRVGHASLLVGNAFIVFGGDTKLEDGDILDDTLYLLNTSTKQWSRASPAGPRPAGRYGHTLNILGSKIYIYGGQVEGYFFNDLVAFDLNTLQSPGNRWDIMIPNNGSDNGIVVPPARTNHSMVTWQDKLYLFGGTDGNQWFNDVWTYDPRTNAWSELDCIGYIPAAREGHAAALVNDTMYIFGGRIQDGSDLGDLAAFRISTRRWYMFENMGNPPSPRSGHSMTAYGKHIVVLGGEPSSAPRDMNELSWSYVLDTSKIRYPPSDVVGQQQQQQQQQLPLRTYSGAGPPGPLVGNKGTVSPPNGDRSQPIFDNTTQNGGPVSAPGSRLPRSASIPVAPMGQIPRLNGNSGSRNGARSRTPTLGGKQSLEMSRPNQYDMGSVPEDAADPNAMNGGAYAGKSAAMAMAPSSTVSRTGSIRTGSRAGSRQARQQDSIDSTGRQTPRASVDEVRREIMQGHPVDSGVGSSPAFTHHHEDHGKELESTRQRNAWLAAELALARKAGYKPNASGSPILDQQSTEAFGDDDKALVEALLRMKSELSRMQGSMDKQAEAFARRIAGVEKQRDAAISEATYAKTKLAAHGGGSQAGTPQPGQHGAGSPELERVEDANRRLAVALKQHGEVTLKVERLTAELESERKARTLANETAEAAQRRVSELDSYRQRTAAEVEGLRAQLHEAERAYREEADNHAQARTSSRMMEVDNSELAQKHSRLLDEHRTHLAVLETLHEAVNASTEKAALLETRLKEERELRTTTEQQYTRLQSTHKEKLSELDSATRLRQEAEELADKHATEARTHREAVLSGLAGLSSRSVSAQDSSDDRVLILQEQLESANALARKNKEAADTAANRLRGAEERIAGLEAYQEQASRDALTVRKQLQISMRDVQSTQTDRNELQQHLERNMLESNALQVQLSTLKNLLDERGVSAADRRSRVLESPSSRYGTPEMGRVRELERQLEESMKAHEEIRSTFEARETEAARSWEQKLQEVDNDRQGAVKYVRGLEKMLAKMKHELQRAKSNNAELEKEITSQKSTSQGPNAESTEWQAERERLLKEMADLQTGAKTSVATLEGQINALKTNLAQTESQRDGLKQNHERQMSDFTVRARSDLEALRRENMLLEQRARDAEHKVQLFLDQFETSVDNYRRMSRDQGGPAAAAGPATARHSATNGIAHRRNNHSIAGESIYSVAETETETDLDISDLAHGIEDSDADDTSHDGRGTPSAHSFPTAGLAGSFAGGPRSAPGGIGKAPSHPAGGVNHMRDRSSTALDGLAFELEALRSQFQETSKSYRDGSVGKGGSTSASSAAAVAPLALGKGGGEKGGMSGEEWRKKLAEEGGKGEVKG